MWVRSETKYRDVVAALKTDLKWSQQTSSQLLGHLAVGTALKSLTGVQLWGAVVLVVAVSLLPGC